MSFAESHDPHQYEPDDKDSAGIIDAPESDNEAAGPATAPTLGLVPDWRVTEEERLHGQARASEVRAALNATPGMRDKQNSGAAGQAPNLRTPNESDFGPDGRLDPKYLDDLKEAQ